MYTLYTKPQCPLCTAAKQLLSSHNVSYTERVIGQDITREEVIAMFPHARMAPIIVKDNSEITMQNLQLLLENVN